LGRRIRAERETFFANGKSDFGVAVENCPADRMNSDGARPLDAQARRRTISSRCTWWLEKYR
jgi:hypothetical protein